MDDLISRQAAIDALQKEINKGIPPFNDVMGSIRCGVRLARNIIEDLPSAQPEQRWIPCGERMPEDGVTVWVTIKGHDVIRCEDGETLEQAIARISKIRWVWQGFYCETDKSWCSVDGFPMMVQPVAWMPMEVPEPYKGEEKWTR